MMETFIVLGLCFILYEALDFFQGCMHSTAPSASDQIDAYRRQLDEQRQQQQQEFILANFTPLLGSLHLSSPSISSTTPTASTASVISDLREQQLLRDREQIAASTPALNNSSNTLVGFRPANKSCYETQELHATSSLPRDYYYVQQQQVKNKNSTKSLLSKFSSNSDNRIYPETASVLGVPSGVITTQPTFVGNSFDCQPPIVPPSPLLLDLRRAILSNNNNNNISSTSPFNPNKKDFLSSFQPKSKESLTTTPKDYTIRTSFRSDNDRDNEDEEESDCENCSSSGSSSSSSSSSSSESESVSAASATLASVAYTSDQEVADERDFERSVSLSSSHADFREIECERLRRKCVSVKRIYSISEKF